MAQLVDRTVDKPAKIEKSDFFHKIALFNHNKTTTFSTT